MPELVSNGPSIPVRLMNEVDSGRVVFFCGAGVSAGRGSDLPGFAGLVAASSTANTALSRMRSRREALHYAARHTELWRPNFDRRSVCWSDRSAWDRRLFGKASSTVCQNQQPTNSAYMRP